MGVDKVTVRYFYSDDCGIPALMKWLRDPEEEVMTGYIWYWKEKKWVEDWSLTCGYFYGFEPAKEVTAQEAIEILVEFGASKEEAQKQIAEDLKKVH